MSTEDHQYYGFGTGFTPSPIYQPSSPHYSNISLEREDDSLSESTFSEPSLDLDDIADELEAYLSNRREIFKRNYLKMQAESQFDKSAQPISISNYHSIVYEEPTVEDFTEEKVDVRIKSEVQNEVEAEKLVIRSICVAQNNCPENSPELILNCQFSDEINSEYLRSLELDLDDYDMTKQLVRNERLVNKNQNLFFERRLMQSIQFRNKSDSEFIKNHFPMKEEFFELDVRYMFNEDSNSLEIIRNKLQTYVQSDNDIKHVFFGNDWKKKFVRRMELKDLRTQQAVLICSYFIFFNQEKFFKQRHLKLLELDEYLFKNSIFKFCTLNNVFRYLGFIFMTDMCNFSFYRDRIINLLDHSHKDVVKKIKKRQKSLKRRKQDTNLIDSVPWFLN